MSADEVFDVFDPYGELTGKTLPKQQVHAEERWHRGAHVWIYNQQGEVLLQLRAPDKDIYPNTWDISAAGHARAGESPVQAAQREAHEELGITLSADQLTFIGVTRTDRPIPKTGYYHRVFDWNYITKLGLDPKKLQLQKEELAAVRWVSLNQLMADLKDPVQSKQYSPRAMYMYDLAITEIRNALDQTV